MNNEQLTEHVVALDERVTRHSEQIKTVFTQLSDLKSLNTALYKLAGSVEALVVKQADTADKVDVLTRKVDDIERKPGKRWEQAITVGITVIVTALVTLVLSGAGIN